MKWLTLIAFLITNCLYGQKNIAFLKSYSPPYELDAKVEMNSITIPMDIVHGMLMVEAQVNGNTGNFILDTGAPMMVLNLSNVNNQDVEASSFANSFTISSTTIDHFQWAGIERDNLEALAVDISHLERASQRKLLGLIGYNLFQHYELFFDYVNSKVILYETDNNPLHRTYVPMKEVSFYLQEHLPVIELTVGGKKVKFGLDTGAEANLIDDDLYAAIDDLYKKDIQPEKIQGLDQQINRTESATIAQNSIEEMQLPEMKFLACDLSHLKKDFNLDIDGLLGYPFFQSMKWSVNYQTRRLNIWAVE